MLNVTFNVSWQSFLTAFLLTVAFSSKPAPHSAPCPTDCTCGEIANESDAAWIDCYYRGRRNTRAIQDVTATPLIDEIDSYLSGWIETLLYLRVNWCVSLYKVPSSVCNMKSLKELDLSHNEIEELPDNCFRRLRNLTEFTATYNFITRLQDGLFDGLSHLRTISLGFNQIDTIELKTFSTTGNLSSLRNINLQYNRLTQLDTWPFTHLTQLNPWPFGTTYQDEEYYQALSGTLSVNLTHNFIERLSNSQNWTYYPNIYIIYRSVLRLDLSFNKVIHFYTLVEELNFSDISDVVALFFDPLFDLILTKNYNYLCDCIDFELHRMRDYLKLNIKEKYRNKLVSFLSVGCSNFNNQSALSLLLEEFVCSVVYMCPTNCTCVNQPSNFTLHVICHNGLEDIPSDIPPLNIPSSLFLQKDLFKYELDFSGNNISTFRPREYLLNARIVDLSSSRLLNITDEAMLALVHVDKIYLHNNLLRALPKVTTTINFTFTMFSIYNNPLSCDCDQAWLKDWLNEVNDRLENTISIQCSFPEWLKGRNIFSVSDADFCRLPTEPLLSYSNLQTIVITVTLFIFTITFGLVVICCFRVKVYTKFGIHPFDRDECEGEDMLFDVFIAFAHEDSQQAREVLNFLESHSLRVCFHERDFLPGDTILENIDSAINGSKRVLCLVSENFMCSGYCLEEFERALHRHISMKHRRLIVMMSEQYEIPLEPDVGLNQRDAAESIDDTITLVQTQQNVMMSSSSKDNARRAAMMHNFVARNTCIKFQSDCTSWQPQLLYAMPMKRLGPAPTNE